MDDSNFLSGELFSTHITKSGHHLATMARSTASSSSSTQLQLDPSGALVPFAPEPEYAIVHQTTPEEFLPAIGRWVKVSGLVMVASFGGAIALSTVLKYKIVTQAPAAIRPVGELRVVQSTIEGSVASIAVRENQSVNKGDPIATVKDFRLESKLITKRDQLVGDNHKAKQQIRAIDLQIGALDRQGVAETEQNARAISGIEADLRRAQRDYHDKGITTQAEVAEAQANWRTAQKEQQAATAELKVAAANLKSIQAGYRSALARSQRYQSAATAGAIATNQLEEAKLAAEQQAQSIAAQVATIAKQQQIVARIAETVTAAETKVQRAQTTLDPIASESQTIVQKIAHERATGKAALARLQQERQKLLQQRTEIVNQIVNNDRDIAQIGTDLRPTIVRAPISGTIQELNLRNNAQVVHAGDRLAQIMPANTPLNIKAFVSTGDIDNVKVGQAVQMRVSACPHTDYGVGSGKVTEIAADAKPIDKNPNQQADRSSQAAANSLYEVTIAPDTTTLVGGGKKCQIRAGLTGRADIISKEQSIFHFLLSKARLLVDP